MKLTRRARVLGSLGPKIYRLCMYKLKDTRTMAVPPSCTIDCRSASQSYLYIYKVPVWVDQPRVEDREDLVSQVHGQAFRHG